MKKLLFLTLIHSVSLTSFAQVPDLVPYLKGKLWGYTDRQKNIVVEPQYSTVTVFLDEITTVKPDTLNSFFIDGQGNRVGKSYDGAAEFSEGLCQVQKNGLQGYIDANGNEAIPLKFKETRKFNEGLAVVRENVLWGVIDKTGTYVIKPKFEQVSDAFQDGFLYIQKKERNFFVDSKGKELKLPDNAKLLDAFHQGMAAVELTLKKNDPLFSKVTTSTLLDSVKVHAFIDNKGKVVLGPFETKYTVGGGFSGGYCVLADNTGYFYYVSKAGKFSDPYTGARLFSEGYALVTKSGFFTATLHLLDSTFKETSLYHAVSDAGTFSDGMMWVKGQTSGLYGFIDKAGTKVIDYRYTTVNDFKNGIAIVEVNGVTFCIDKTGNEFRDNPGTYNQDIYYDDDDWDDY